MMASKDTFKPGLFDIGLNIEKKLGNHYLNTDKKNLTHYLEIDPIYIKPATRNLIAVLLFHMDIGRTRARLMLEELCVDFPDELNALADLIYVYKQMGRMKDALRYRERLESHKDNPLLQARSILGQAYALTYDLVDNHNNTPKAFLKTSWRILNMEDNHTEQVIKANSLIVDAYKMLTTISETAHEHKIKAKQNAVERFERGIEKLKELNCSKEEILTWKHKLAVARGRLDTWRNRKGDSIDIRSVNCAKLFEDYSYVIDSLISVENLEEPLKLCLAKSCIFFAQMYTSRKNFVDKDHLSENVKKKIQDLDTLVDKARELCPNSKTILARYGRIKASNQQYLEAIRIYTKSIELLPDKDINWFSYSSRGEAFYFYSKELIRKNSDQKKIDKYLSLAYSDMQICLQTKCTQFCMLQMAKICFQRALPAKIPCIRFKCQKIDFIYEALDIVYEAINKRDINNDARISSVLGKYYLYINEYRKSIESIKTALELNKWSTKYPMSFAYLSYSFMCFYNESGDRNLLSEFRYVLREAKERQRDIWVTNALKTMDIYFPKMLSDLIVNMDKWDAKGCESIVREVLQNSWYVNCNVNCNRFEMRLQKRNNKKSDVNGPAEIRVFESSEIFVYDFFVLHSEKDKEWVNFMLRPKLEEYDDVFNFRGCFPSRDFKPGEKTLDSMSNAINKSRKLLIILTPSNSNDNWMKCLTNACISSMIESKAKEKAVIPIVRESCEISDMLKLLGQIDFTQKNDWDHLRMRLTV